jgi:hypothetical protein
LQRIPHVGEFPGSIRRLDSSCAIRGRVLTTLPLGIGLALPSPARICARPILKEEWKVELLAGGGVLCGVWGMLQYTRNRADAAERLAV